MRPRLAIAAAAVAATAALAGTAAAHPGGPSGQGGPESGQARNGDGQLRSGPAAFRGPARGGRGRGARGCEIADSELLTTETSAALKRRAEKLAERVEDDKITQARADRILERTAIRLTVNTTRRDASLAPVLKLVDMTAAEYRAALKDKGLRQTLEDAGVSVSDWRTARREGRVDARQAVRDLCASGADEDEGDAAS
jgi:hypothetical protein